jgi:hypothetical protein
MSIERSIERNTAIKYMTGVLLLKDSSIKLAVKRGPKALRSSRAR